MGFLVVGVLAHRIFPGERDLAAVLLRLYGQAFVFVYSFSPLFLLQSQPSVAFVLVAFSQPFYANLDIYQRFLVLLKFSFSFCYLLLCRQSGFS